MSDPVLVHVGSRIRLYRKSSGLSMEQLAAKIHKSKASVSKYESGATAVDVRTLYDIAQALGVELERLADIPVEGQKKTVPSPFGSCSLLYMYHMARGRVYTSHMELDSHGKATLFYKVPEDGGVEGCDCIYHGEMLSHSTVLSFCMANYHNAAENILLNFFVPMRKASVLTGMITGLGSNNLVPEGYKVILSPQPMEDNQRLRALVTIAPASFGEMKRRNALFIALE